MSERVEYIIDKTSDGKEVFVGRSVNYNVLTQASSLNELKRKIKIMIDTWLEHGTETMQGPNPVDLKEITKEEWQAQYAEWMKTSKWVNIADALYDTIKDLVGDKWSNDATENYEKNTTRKSIRDKVR